MPKIKKKARSVTLSEDVQKAVDKLSASPQENRSFSNMVEVLLKEAIENRKGKK